MTCTECRKDHRITNQGVFPREPKQKAPGNPFYPDNQERNSG